MDELQKIFQRFDTDNSGFIEVDELHDVLDALGIDSRNDDAVLSALVQLRTENPSRVTWEELRTWWAGPGARAANAKPDGGRQAGVAGYSPDPGEAKPVPDLPNELQLRALFRRFDEDDSGYIDKDELAHLLEAAGRNPDDEQVNAAMRVFDDNVDGKLSWGEFLAWWYELLEEEA